MTIAAQILEQRNHEARERAEAERRRASHLFRDAVLACEDAAGDEAVADAAGPAGKSADDINSAFRLRDNARRMQSLAANIDAAEQEYKNELMRAAAQQFVFEQRSRLSKLEQIDSRNYRDQCKAAIRDLQELADATPEFFDRSGSVPELVGDNVAAQAADAAAARKVERSQSRLLMLERELRTATARLERDLPFTERASWAAWKMDLQKQVRNCRKAVERSDDATADTSDADASDAE